ncbi:MAG: response regulator transcription factor [Clostridia bacterium]|nr:response regulator transcription factor [Clostridia bacterium]
MSKKILIVDDEKAIVDILNHNLKREGYETVQAYDGEEAVNLVKSENPDLVLLDVMLPKMDGFSVCKMVRQSSNIPIIMVTAKEDVVDKVIGLELGADDYITKPFSVREVLARVKANLRKWEGIELSKKETENATETKTSLLEFGPLTLDTFKYEAKVSGKSVELTLREFELLKFLATQSGQVFSREELLEKVWGYEYFGDVRTVDVTVRRIREKIEKNPSAPELLATKRGIGYYFNLEV